MIKRNIRLIKCHFSFCFNKITVLLILLMFVSSLIYNLLVIKSLDKSESSQTLWSGYLESSMSFFSFLSIVFSIIVYSYSFLSKQDSYLSYLVGPKVSKISYFVTKLITIFIFIFIFLLLLILSFFIPLILIHSFQLERNVMMSFLDILKVMMFYGIVSLLLILAFDNMYVAIIPIILFIFSTNITLLDRGLVKVASFIIPLFSESYTLLNPRGVVMTLVFIMSIVSVVFYYYRD